MKKYYLILSVFIFIICLAFGCSSTDDGDSSDASSDATVQEDVEYLASGVLEIIGSVFANDTLPSGVTAVSDQDALTMALTFDNATGGDRGYTANGTLNGVGTLSSDNTIITIVISGTLNLTGGQISTMVWDMTIVAPWDNTERDLSAAPTSVTGTITADDVEYNLADLNILDDDDGGGSGTDPQFVVAGMKNDDQSLIIYSADGTEWGSPNIAHMSTPSESLKGIDCDPSGDCVAMGDNGTVFYSTNGTSWTAGTSSVSHNLTGVAYGESRWVAVGADSSSYGAVLYSDDTGQTWNSGSPSTSTLMYQFNDVAYGNSQWVAISPASQQFYSLNGSTWTEFNISGVTGNSMKDIVFGSNTWVAVGDSGTIIYASDPAGTWSVGTYSGAQFLVAIGYGNNRFIAVGSGAGSAVLIVSDDNGQTWTEKTLPSEFTSTGNPLTDLAYGNGIWSVMSGSGDHLLSTDNGDSWTVAALDSYGAYAISYRAR